MNSLKQPNLPNSFEKKHSLNFQISFKGKIPDRKKVHLQNSCQASKSAQSDKNTNTNENTNTGRKFRCKKSCQARRSAQVAKKPGRLWQSTAFCIQRHFLQISPLKRICIGTSITQLQHGSFGIHPPLQRKNIRRKF